MLPGGTEKLRSCINCCSPKDLLTFLTSITLLPSLRIMESVPVTVPQEPLLLTATVSLIWHPLWGSQTTNHEIQQRFAAASRVLRSEYWLIISQVMIFSAQAMLTMYDRYMLFQKCRGQIAALWCQHWRPWIVWRGRSLNTWCDLWVYFGFCNIHMPWQLQRCQPWWDRDGNAVQCRAPGIFGSLGQQ